MYLLGCCNSAKSTLSVEIVNAEKLLANAKLKIGKSRRDGATQIPEHHYVMPMESWSKYKDLFVKDFTDKQWNKIDRFYNNCQLFDETITYNDSRFINDTREIRKNVHKAIYKYASEYAEKILTEKDEVKKDILIQELKNKKNELAGILTNADYMYTCSPTKPVRDIEKYIDTIETDTSKSDEGRKFRSIANGHWWW